MYELSVGKVVLRVQLDEGEQPNTVENADGWVTTEDGSVWSATFVTYAELGRILDRWAGTGEGLGGRYFVCPDLVVTRSPGVEEMLAAVNDLASSGDIAIVLGRVEEDA